MVEQVYVRDCWDRQKTRNAMGKNHAYSSTTVHNVSGKRMAEKQQMRWTKKGAHPMIRIRKNALNDEF